jgi:hypothetical protein
LTNIRLQHCYFEQDWHPATSVSLEFSQYRLKSEQAPNLSHLGRSAAAEGPNGSAGVDIDAIAGAFEAEVKLHPSAIGVLEQDHVVTGGRCDL